MKIGIGAHRVHVAPTDIHLDGRKLSISGTTEDVSFMALSAGWAVEGNTLVGPAGTVLIRAKTKRGLILTKSLEVT